MEHNKNQDYIVIDFGKRTISNQQSSRIVALPKTALLNLSEIEFSKVRIRLVQQNGEKFLKITPEHFKEDEQSV